MGMKTEHRIAIERAVRIAGLLALLITLLVLLTACGGGDSFADADDEMGPPDLRGIPTPPACTASGVCR